jgi:hypothetical protein
LHPVTTLEDALRVVGFYQQRWLIEEFHKALKTGCRLERGCTKLPNVGKP